MVKGIGEVLADKVIDGRPCESEADVLENKNLPPSVVQLVKAHRRARKAS
jgi:hypothetical protein